MSSLIEANLKLCRIPKERYEIVVSDAADFLRREQKHSELSWDIVFFDPPYSNDYTQTLSLLASSSLLNKDSVLIVEHHSKNNLPDTFNRLKLYRTVKQGDSSLSFYESEDEI